MGADWNYGNMIRTIISVPERLAEKKGISLTAKAQSMEEYKESQYDKLADLVRRSLDMEAVYKIMEEYES